MTVIERPDHPVTVEFNGVLITMSREVWMQRLVEIEIGLGIRACGCPFGCSCTTCPRCALKTAAAA